MEDRIQNAMNGTVILHATENRCIQERFRIHGTFVKSKPLYTGDRYKSLYKERSSYEREELDHDCSSLMLPSFFII